jgi:hypothetical protein
MFVQSCVCNENPYDLGPKMPPPHNTEPEPIPLADRVATMSEEVSAIAQKRPAPKPPGAMPPMGWGVLAGLGAALLDQGAPLLGMRLWHPFSLLPSVLPWTLIKQHGALLRDVAPFVWPSLAGIAGAAAAFALRPSEQRGRRDISCALAGFTWDRNSFCRGWLCTGATGSGKTQAAVNPVMHQVFMREAGEEKPGWDGSPLQAKLEQLLAAYDAATQPIYARLKETEKELERLMAERDALYQEATIEEIDGGQPAGLPVLDDVEQEERNLCVEREVAFRDWEKANEASQGAARKRLEEVDSRLAAVRRRKTEERHASLSTVAVSKGPAGRKLQALDVRIAEYRANVDRLEMEEILPLRERLQSQLRRIEPARYTSFPWGGICIDEKGLYYQTLSRMARNYRRDHHLMLLQTRPTWAGSTWRPPARFNLLSDEQIPANTYAKAIVDTASSVAGGEGDKGFFRTQAESNIGWAIELQRAVKRCRLALGDAPGEMAFPSIKLTLELLSNNKTYTEWLTTQGALDAIKNAPKGGDKRKRSTDQPVEEVRVEARIKSPELTVAMEHFAVRYWKQPPDQLGGVQGTIYNYLNYFTNDEVAEVFCADNTFDFRDVDRGMILCVAMPQKLQVERRYVCTLLKLLFYQHVLRRFDLGDKSPEWINRNLLICWQDEAQRFVTDSDGNVDVIREAGATTFMACQAKPSLYAPLGGKEKASVTLLNLRNRIVFQAADDDCANGSSEFLGKVERTKKTHSTSSSGTSYSYSKEDMFLIKPHEFRALPKFTAVVCHADSKWRRAIICPITPDGRLRREWLTSAQRLSYWWQEKMGRGWAAITRPSNGSTKKSNVKN